MWRPTMFGFPHPVLQLHCELRLQEAHGSFCCRCPEGRPAWWCHHHCHNGDRWAPSSSGGGRGLKVSDRVKEAAVWICWASDGNPAQEIQSADEAEWHETRRRVCTTLASWSHACISWLASAVSFMPHNHFPVHQPRLPADEWRRLIIMQTDAETFQPDTSQPLMPAAAIRDLWPPAATREIYVRVGFLWANISHNLAALILSQLRLFYNKTRLCDSLKTSGFWRTSFDSHELEWLLMWSCFC